MERKLASVLSEAFLQREVASKRLETVSSFLDKFNLTEQDSRLLDHYAFEDIATRLPPNSLEAMPNGVAFLAALERIRKIRDALATTFGTTSTSDLLTAEELQARVDDLEAKLGAFGKEAWQIAPKSRRRRRGK